MDDLDGPSRAIALVKADDLEGLRALLDEVPTAHQDQGHMGRTPLHVAVERRATDVVKLLLERGADVDARRHRGDTPLCWARDADMADRLLRHGADVNAADATGRGPLHWHATSEPAVLQLLLAHDADVNALDDSGTSPLLAVCDARLGNEPSAEVLAGRLQRADLLLGAGADPNARGRFGRVPLHEPAKTPYGAALVARLLEAGADPTVPDDHRRTPIDVAAPTIHPLLTAHTEGWDHSRYSFWWDVQARAIAETQTIEQLVERIVAAEHGTKDGFRGCSAEELADLEAAHGLTLPEAYRSFLAVMGQETQGLFAWDHLEVHYPYVLTATAEQRQYAIEDDELSAFEAALGPCPLLICGRLGEQFFFLRGDDPKAQVWYWNYDAEPGISRVAYASVMAFLVSAHLRLL